MARGSDGWMTIEELSLRSGVTSRNIRAYQSKGLLAPPLSRSGERSAFYTLDHLARLRLVERLQARGFSLAGIGHLLAAWGEGSSLEQVLGVESAVEKVIAEQSTFVTKKELTAMLAPVGNPKQAIKKLAGVGLLVAHENGYRLRSAKVFELGIDAVRAGIPFDALLAELVKLQEDLHRIALRYVDMFTSYVLSPYVEAGMPAERTSLIAEQAKRLRDLAAEACQPLMRQAIADEIEAASRDAALDFSER